MPKIIIITCPKHGDFRQKVDSHMNQGQGCRECNIVDLYSFIERANEIHNNYYDYSKSIIKGMKYKINIICTKHGEFTQRASAHLEGQGCVKCKTSKGELMIEKLLIDLKIDYITQKKFEGCLNKRKLKFDFFIPSLNICIEYNGEQHYRPIKYFGGEKSFKKQLIRDNIKKEYCENNNIKLAVIRYNEDIDEKLTQYLK